MIKTKEEKEYEVTGVLTYAHCFSVTVYARNQKEAREQVKKGINRLIDPAIAEFQEAIIDKPILVK